MVRKVEIYGLDSFELIESIRASVKQTIEEVLSEKGLTKQQNGLGEYCTQREAEAYLKVSRQSFRTLLKNAEKKGLQIDVMKIGPKSLRFKTNQLSVLMQPLMNNNTVNVNEVDDDSL